MSSPILEPGAVVIAVIGGGIMGRGIALALASAGQTVAIVESDAAALESLANGLATQAREAGTDPADVGATLGRISLSGDLDDPVRAAGIVIEAVPETMDVKVQLWRRIGELASPQAVLATNTSAFDIDALAALAPDPSRFLGTHWFNPATLVPCVEVVRGSATSQAVVDRVCTILLAAGKSPVVVLNSPGFVANRIQFALVREAMLCLEEGLASADDIDKIVSSSFGPRLAVLGPLANADLGGLDTYRSILISLASALGDRFTVPAVLDDLVSAGRFGTKSLSGISDYTVASAQLLIDHRDVMLRRVLHAARRETGELE